MISNEEILERVRAVELKNKELEQENQLLKKKLELGSGYRPETLSEEREEALLKRLEHRTGRRDILKAVAGMGILGAVAKPAVSTTITDEGINTGKLLSDIDAQGYSIDNLKSVRTENIFTRSRVASAVVWQDGTNIYADGLTA